MVKDQKLEQIAKGLENARSTTGIQDRFAISVTKTKGAKCPRCYRYTREGHFNFAYLCDRCAQVVVTHFPDHPACPDIRAAYRAFRKMSSDQRLDAQMQIDAGTWVNPFA